MPPLAHAHALFQRYPLTGQVQLSTGPAPTPYHIYAGSGVFVGGTADLEAVHGLLQTEQVYPLVTTASRALMGVWVMDFTEASLDPHHELQFSLFVTRQPAPARPAHRLAVVQAWLTRPETRMLCHGLWNNTARVTAYNREILGLNAQLGRSQITLAAGALTFGFEDQATGRPLLHGRLRAAQNPSVRATWDFMRLLGFGSSRRVAAQPWVEMKVINPLGLRPRHEAALAATHSDRSALRYFDPRTDRLAIAAAPYQGLDFQPQFVQHLSGIKFVYLNPQPE
ncbi:MAG: hypothetical protein KA764_11900 [Anaerolineales bacterium]|nr:hypothetical protein [Anaerolineales bacterium]